jgi:hypothetical protein
MFEYGNEKVDPAKIAVWSVVVPLGIFWAFHRSLLSAFLLQASVISIAAFFYGLKVQDAWENISKYWFIKTIFVTTCLIHPSFLVIAWYLDASYPILITGVGSIFVTGFVVGVIEMVVVAEITKRFRSLDANEG